LPSQIILASRSPRRVELLRQIGIEAEIMPADIDESVLAAESPPEYVLRMAREKAKAVEPAGAEDTLIIAADTAVVVGGRIYGKPASEADAAAMLRSLSGRTHHVLSAVALRQGNRLSSRLSDSAVTFRPLSDAEIQRYWQSGEPVDKAGGYAIQGLGAVFIASIEGSYSGIMGLPLQETAALLAECGFRVL